MLNTILQISLIVLAPLCCIYFSKKAKVEKWLSPVVLSYAVGIAFSNFNLLSVSKNISMGFSQATILLAIPLLLYSTDIIAWTKHAKSTILSFVLCVLSGVFCSIAFALLFKNAMDDTWLVAGMMVGIYTGGIPNMQAIGMALGADDNWFILLSAADIFCGGLYLFFLTSVAHQFLGLFLPDFKSRALENQKKSLEEEVNILNFNASTFKMLLPALALTLVIVATSAGLTFVLTGALENATLLILLLTTFSILASLKDNIRNTKGGFELGEYFLLMFCVAVGLMSDLKYVWEEGGQVILFMACILVSTAGLHFLLSALFRIDRDTTLITSTAALYGPVFIGQVASAIKNRELVFSGIATGLVGFAIGNYLGIAVAYFLKMIL